MKQSALWALVTSRAADTDEITSQRRRSSGPGVQLALVPHLAVWVNSQH